MARPLHDVGTRRDALSLSRWETTQAGDRATLVDVLGGLVRVLGEDSSISIPGALWGIANAIDRLAKAVEDHGAPGVTPGTISTSESQIGHGGEPTERLDETER